MVIYLQNLQDLHLVLDPSSVMGLTVLRLLSLTRELTEIISFLNENKTK